MPKKKRNTPPKWHNVYTGSDEAKFFRVLARNPRFDWRSTGAISKEAGLSKDRVEEIILKYFYDGKNKVGMVFQSPKNEDHWGYWERVPEMLPEEKSSISATDKNARIDKAMKSEVTEDNGPPHGDYPEVPQGYVRSKYPDTYMAPRQAKEFVDLSTDKSKNRYAEYNALKKMIDEDQVPKWVEIKSSAKADIVQAIATAKARQKKLSEINSLADIAYSSNGFKTDKLMARYGEKRLKEGGVPELLLRLYPVLLSN